VAPGDSQKARGRRQVADAPGCSVFRATRTATGLAAVMRQVDADLEAAGNLISQGLDALPNTKSAA
jgi:hypothetical protein